MPNSLPLIGSDGFYHPASEADLIALVQQANASGLELRVRGAAHSVSCAIYTDSCSDNQNKVSQQTPPSSTLNMNVMLDKYRGILNVDQANMRVEVQAGINLGYNPSDPTGTSTLENSLLYQLWQNYGWTLPDLGGITHQTVSGFISTGSSGGSLTYSINDAIYAIRMVDGQGNVYTVSREDTDKSLFNAAALSMGLLGTISTITFQCVPTFNITGQESIVTYQQAAVDVFGPGGTVDGVTRPSLQQFITGTEYSRMIWWPQSGGFLTQGTTTDRLVIWQCQRMAPQPGFLPTRYQEFTNDPLTAELAESIFLTIVGNLDDIEAVSGLLTERFAALYARLAEIIGGSQTLTVKPAVSDLFTWISSIPSNPKAEMPHQANASVNAPVLIDSLFGELSRAIDGVTTGAGAAGNGNAAGGTTESVGGIIDDLKNALLALLEKILVTDASTTISVIAALSPVLKFFMPDLFPMALNIFVALDSTKSGMSQGEPQAFRDYGWSGLPMDNQADDDLLATEFTEIWLPIGRTQQVMDLLRSYFTDTKADPWTRLSRTGTYGWEFYGAGPTDFWMSPSYSNGTDEWKDGVFRIDPYWYAWNAGNPAEVFYPQLWNLLRTNNIPFRLHWGKFQPVIAQGDPDGWVSFFKSQYAMWDNFLALRAQKDPNNIFLTDYWRSRFGLADLPRPKASVTTTTSVQTPGT